MLYQLSYTGLLLFFGPTMALLILLSCLEPVGLASHSRGDPLITNDVLYLISYTGHLLFGSLADPVRQTTKAGWRMGGLISLSFKTVYPYFRFSPPPRPKRFRHLLGRHQWQLLVARVCR